MFKNRLLLLAFLAFSCFFYISFTPCPQTELQDSLDKLAAYKAQLTELATQYQIPDEHLAQLPQMRRIVELENKLLYP